MRVEGRLTDSRSTSYPRLLDLGLHGATRRLALFCPSSATIRRTLSSDDSSPERRDSARSPIELKVEYKRLNTFFADYTKNISKGGTFIKTNRPLPIGTEFVFKLFVPTLNRPLTIHGEVQRVVLEGQTDGDEPGMAIRFVYRHGDARGEVEALVEELMSSTLGPRISTGLMDATRRRTP
jgi:type IV pilus assembly protein PilZ